MSAAKNEIFICLLHEKFYLRELTYGMGRNRSSSSMNEQISG